MVARRLGREPVSRILGRRGFWTLDLALGPATLDPRPDSETVVEAVLAALPEPRAPLRLLDFGTGSGCLLLALLVELPTATGLGIDRSLAALEIARANARAAGLAGRAAFVQADWGGPLAGRFEVIVTNPPYIPSGDIAGLQPEVADFDPRLALDGGDDGLDCYRALVPDIARLLAPGGVAALEVGRGQAAAVGAMLTAAGLESLGARRDLGGVERCVTALQPP
jgi:release factor glutamine methyltransferase